MEIHTNHVLNREYHSDCEECLKDATAIDWLMAVRQYGIETANKMFPEG